MSSVTIYEIAKEAGCSASTVSRVINGYPYVKKATRAKVLKIIENRNFVPNETARNLVTQSTRMIGILIADIRTAQHTDGIYHIERELSKHGYSCIICNTGPETDAMTGYIQMLSQRNVEAVILMGSIYQNDAVSKAIQLYIPDIPVVLCNGYLEGENTYGIISDEDTGVMNCVKLLSDTGHKNIAFIYDKKTPSNLKKIEGFKYGMSRFGYDADKMAIIETPSEVDKIYDTVKIFLNENPETDGIIFSEDFLGLAALQLLADMNIKVPQQIAVIGINNSRYAEIGIPPLTSLDNKLYDTSITAVRTILSLLKGETACKKVLLFSDIVQRKSTRSELPN